jgi:hypothetical protein
MQCVNPADYKDEQTNMLVETRSSNFFKSNFPRLEASIAPARSKKSYVVISFVSSKLSRWSEYLIITVNRL